MTMSVKNIKTTRSVWYLGWSEMQKRKITLFIPKEIVEVSDWFHAKKTGELCINSKGEVDRLKSVKHVGGAGTIFRVHEQYSFENDTQKSNSAYLVGVRKGKMLKRWNKTFTYAEHGLKAIIDARKD